MSPGSAIEQAARAAAMSRGGYGGATGEYGLGPQASQGKIRSDLDVLSDTQGVDFGPYLQRVLQSVRRNWYILIPEVARAPLMKKGKVSIQFVILPDGKVAGMQTVLPSGDIALDRAAWGGITNSNPFPPLPQDFHGPYLALRFHFFYNPEKNEIE
jgi:TonB family protein